MKNLNCQSFAAAKMGAKVIPGLLYSIRQAGIDRIKKAAFAAEVVG